MLGVATTRKQAHPFVPIHRQEQTARHPRDKNEGERLEPGRKRCRVKVSAAAAAKPRSNAHHGNAGSPPVCEQTGTGFAARFAMRSCQPHVAFLAH
jgi:hypothetical protein